VPDLIAQIDALLPQTQCQQCGYPRCREYAEALASSQARPNRCPPGGEFTLSALAQLLDTGLEPLDPEVGAHSPRLTVRIDETRCIGCTLCIAACPVDAILGCAKRMHSVFDEECTGCLLCLPACPVDCIVTSPWSQPVGETGHWPEYPQAQVDRARTRVSTRQKRLEKLKRLKRKSVDQQPNDSDVIQDEIRAAVERARLKLKRSGH
jgi:electron transport complex protein RnfB